MLSPIVSRVVQTGTTITSGNAAVIADGAERRVNFIVTLSAGTLELYLRASAGAAGEGIIQRSTDSPFIYPNHYYGPICARAIGGNATYTLAEGFY